MHFGGEEEARSGDVVGGTEGRARALDVRGLSVGWDGVPLLRDVTFHVDRGEIFAILGGSGSGKSTLMRFLVGLEAPLAGEIDIGGKGPPDLERGLPPFGVMFQEGALFGGMTLGENVGLALEEWTELPPGAIHAISRAKLRLVGLDDAADKLPSEVSGGMKKRAAIARAIALDPPLLFLDEPIAGLDPVSAADFDELVVELNRTLGITVVVVTHELGSLFRTASRCILLDREAKGIIAEGDPRELRSSRDPRVHAFFNRHSQREESK